MKDTRTQQQNQQWWLEMAARYEKEAPNQKTEAKQRDYVARATAARDHAATYTSHAAH